MLRADGAVIGELAPKRDPRGRWGLAPLRGWLEEWKRRHPAAESIAVHPEDEVRYEDMVWLLDTCIGAGFPSISVTASG